MSSLPSAKALKQLLNRHSAVYSVAKTVRRWTRVDLRWRDYRRDAFRRRCYAQYHAGNRVLSRSYGAITVAYEAMSPKNYYHLSVGSQHEDQFMPELFEQCIDKGDVVLDIGAHTGMYSIPFAKAVGRSGKVYAFEPEALGYNAILRNAQLNSLGNIEVIEMAVTDADGTVDFFVRPDKDTHSIFEQTRAPSPSGIQHKVSVTSSSVDSLLDRGLIAQPDFVKIDVEGGELKVLDGMEKAALGVRHVLVEIHAAALRLLGVEEPAREVESRLLRLGFTDLRSVDDLHVLGSKPGRGRTLA